jgi:glycosyltransferase involved in cell wall biosynthesis
VRQSKWAAPQPWRLRLRRAFGQTRVGDALRRAFRETRRLAPGTHGSLRIPATRLPDRVQNVVLVSPTDFTGNTALHVYWLATELSRQGIAPAVAVPANVESVGDLGTPSFPVLSYGDAARQIPFVDLVHAFTPRRHVRRLTLELAGQHGCAYVVHLEDNETVVPTAGDPHAAAFVEGAAAATVVIDRLLELVPHDVPHAVVWPGFDPAVLTPRQPRAIVRAELGVGDGVVVLYTGNVHAANLDAVANLYSAVERLRKDGLPVVLVRTGWNFVARARLPRLGRGLIELGWVARRHVPDLLHAADVLVQPRGSGEFDDYRFPSKVPEFLASGRPVVLPRTNIGLHLKDGEEALLLEQGDPVEIAEKVALLTADGERRARLGERGREFALRELRWERAARSVLALYRRIEAGEAARAGHAGGRR